MNEYDARPHEYGLYEERVRHIQLAYASYAALLAVLEGASLLGRMLEYVPLCYRAEPLIPCHRNGTNMNAIG